tara:strand:- start:804 stop:1079 length:276 start_codon:yes stop_codon:yes gene_type:complete
MTLSNLIYFVVFIILSFVIFITFRALNKVSKFKQDKNKIIEGQELKNKFESMYKKDENTELINQINELNKLHSEGTLNDDEFKKAKEKILK